ncbi:MAG: hypothetical protein LBN95_03950 [Prevotellaceae bacterium]|jgi:polyferredoxin|nr:hypothetical protein [Prevotellaceae bacterium]
MAKKKYKKNQRKKTTRRKKTVKFDKMLIFAIIFGVAAALAIIFFVL